MKHNILFNCETADPDDMLTLCMLSHHPQVNLVGITICPGSNEQVQVIKDVLCILDRLDVPVGVRTPDYPKKCVSEFHYKWLKGKQNKVLPLMGWRHNGLGEDLIAQTLQQYSDLKIVSGAALSCVAKFLDKYDNGLDEVVVQGGFAGEGVVPEEYQLPKFKGKITCPSFNLNADVPAALKVISTNKIKQKTFVSKNVCHGVIYDQEMHERIKPHRNDNPGLNLLVDGMEYYLKNKPSGKAFHDPLAACVAIDPSICKYAEVEFYREKGEWGSRWNVGLSDNYMDITISVDREKFERVLIGK